MTMEDSNMPSYGAAEPMGSMGMSSDEPYAEFDGSFEPFSRGRANTWHAGLFYEDEGQDRQIASEENSQSASTDQGHLDELEAQRNDELQEVPSVLPRKNVTRRNAWGQLSYSDLIVRAIESSPDQRATLSMIYEWMIKTIPYFHDKGDSNSSAGWKNSIRHNLSLQPRFMRVPNEGTGKSSWWVINHEANSKLLKIPPRRRASTLDTKLYEKRRTRPKKKPDVTTTPACSLNSLGDSSATDELTDGFSAIPTRLDYRCRANSNASSIGRLSPIAALTEDDHIARPLSLQNGRVNAQWDKVGMECEEYSNVTEELLLNSLSVYDNPSKNQTHWDVIAPMPVLPTTVVRKVDFDVNSAEIGSSGFKSGVMQQLDSEVISSRKSNVTADEISRQRGINRLRSFLTNPTTQTILSAKPELLARVREMILNKRKQMLSTQSVATSQVCSTMNSQQMLAGGNITAEDNTGFASMFGAQYLSDMEAVGTDSEINHAIEQALSMADFSLDQIPYELMSDDLLA